MNTGETAGGGPRLLSAGYFPLTTAGISVSSGTPIWGGVGGSSPPYREPDFGNPPHIRLGPAGGRREKRELKRAGGAPRGSGAGEGKRGRALGASGSSGATVSGEVGSSAFGARVATSKWSRGMGVVAAEYCRGVAAAA